MFYPSVKAQLFGEIASYLFLDLNGNHDYIYVKRATTLDFNNSENDMLVTLYGKNDEEPKVILIECIKIEQNGRGIKKNASSLFEVFEDDLEKLFGKNIHKLEENKFEHFYLDLKQNFSDMMCIETNNLLPSFQFYKDEKNNMYINLNKLKNINLQPFIVTALSALLLMDKNTKNYINLMDVVLRNKSLKDLTKDKYIAVINPTLKNLYNVNPVQNNVLKLWEIDRTSEDIGLFLVRGGDLQLKYHRVVPEQHVIAHNLEETNSKTRFLVNDNIDFEVVCQKHDIVHEVEYTPGTHLLHWLRSSKQTSLIYKKYTANVHYARFHPAEHSVNVISGSAGCGKRLNLAKIMYDLQTKDKAKWVASIQGSDLELALSEQVDIDDITTLLKKLFKVTSRLEDDIFNFSIKISGRLVLFVDDIDNIPKKFIDKVLIFIEKLFVHYPTVLFWMSCRESFTNILLKIIPIFPYTLNYEKDLIDYMLPKQTETESYGIIENIFHQNKESFLKSPFNIDLIRQKIETNGIDGSLYILDVYDFYIEQKLKNFNNKILLDELIKSSAFIFFNTEPGLDFDLEENFTFYTVFGQHKDRIILEYLTAKYLLNHSTITMEIMFMKQMAHVMNLYDRLQFRHTKFGSLILNGNFEEILLLVEKESPVNITDSLNRSLLYIVYDKEENLGILDFLIDKGVPIDKVDYLTNDTIEAYFNKKRAYPCIDILLKYKANWTKFNFVLDCDLNELNNIFHNNYLGVRDYNICKLILDKRKDFVITPFLVYIVTLTTDDSNQNFIKQVLRLAVEQGISTKPPYIDSYGQSAVHKVAQLSLHSLEVVKILVKELNYDICLQDSTGCTPLCYAMDINTIDYLIKNGVHNVNKDFNLKKSFHAACIANNFEIIKYFIENIYSDIKKIDELSPFYCAVLSRNIEIIKYLYQKGFTNVNQTNINDATPLHLACSYGNFEIVKFLVEHGANVNAFYKKNRPIDFLCIKGHKSLQIYNYLIENGCTFNVNLLYILLKTSNFKVFKKKCDELNVDWNVKNDDGYTFLHYSALYLHDKDILEYITIRSNLEIPEDQNMATALHLAVSVNNMQAFEILIKLGANIHATTKNGETLMHFAAKAPNYSTFKTLFDHGLNVNQKDNAGRSPVHNFVCSGSYDLVAYLLEKGLDINSQDNEGRTALHNIFRYKTLFAEASAESCFRDIRIDANIKDTAGRVALHYAIEKEYLEIIKILSRYQQLDIDVTDAKGESPLSLSEKLVNKTIYQYLCSIRLNCLTIDYLTAHQRDFIYMRRASTFDFFNAENDILVTLYGKSGESPKAIFVELINSVRNSKNTTKKQESEINFFELFAKNIKSIYGENMQSLTETNTQHFYVELKKGINQKNYIENEYFLSSFHFYKGNDKNIYIILNESKPKANLHPFVVTALSAIVLMDNNTTTVLNLMDVVLRNKFLKDLTKDKDTTAEDLVPKNCHNVHPKQNNAFKLWEFDKRHDDLKLFLVRGDEHGEFFSLVPDEDWAAYDLTQTSNNTRFLVHDDVDFEEVCEKHDIVHEVDYISVSKQTIWLRSNKQSSMIYKYALPSIDGIESDEKSIKIISGPSGCGKSFNLNKVFHSLRFADRARWIEMLYGSDLEKILCQISSDDNTVNLLYKLFKITNSLEEDIFNFSLKIPGRLVLFVDDIDNINKKSTSKVLNFIKKLFFDYPSVAVWMSCRETFTDMITQSVPIFPHILTYEKDLIGSILPQVTDVITANVIEKIHKQNSQAILKNPFNIDLIRQKIDKDGSDGSLYIIDVYDFYIEQKLLNLTNVTSIEEQEQSAAYIFFGTESGLDIDFEENLVFHTVFGKHKDRVIIEYLTAKYLLNHPSIINNIMFKKEMTQVMKLYNRLQFRHSKFGSLVLNGKFEEILVLAEEESPALVSDMLNRTLLYVVDDECEHAGILDFLIEKGVPIDKINNLTNDTVETSFDKKRSFKYIEILLRHGADWTRFNSILKCDSTVLSYIFRDSCLAENYKICELILNERKDFQMTRYLVFVVTKMKSYNSQKAIIKALRLAVEQGLSEYIEYFDSYEGTAIHNAARFTFCGLEIMKILIDELGYDVNVRDRMHAPPIYYADDIKVIDYLIRSGADPYNDEFYFALRSRFHSACTSGRFDIIKLYLEELSLDISKLNKIPPLYCAVQSGDIEIMKYLYEKGFKNVNQTYLFGGKALHAACMFENFEMVKFLVENGADVNTVYRNQLPIEELSNQGKNNSLKIYNFLIESGCKFNTNLLYLLLKTSNFDAFKKSCEELKVDWNHKNNDGYSFLHYAALHVHDINTFEYIAARTNLELPDDYSMATPLHLAFSVANVEAITTLIKLGANVDAKSGSGETMMHFAARSPNKVSFKILFDHGLDINQKDKEGSSPIQNFIFSGRYELASFFIQNGMDPNSQDNDGKTALHNICESDSEFISEGVESCLKDMKANIHIRDNKGRVPFHYILQKHNFENLIAIFTKYEMVDVEAADINGDSPLSLAKKMRIRKPFKILNKIKTKQMNFDKY